MSALLAGIVMTDPVKPKQWASTALSDTSNAAKNEKRPSDGIGMALPGSTPLTPILDFSGTSYRWDVMSFIQ
ncbi:MAG: hypothetical protein IPN00_04340 [Hydrogenophilales bacterium]|nr:hypothetical protein [Hydrogenophilales bacterium]